MEEELINFDDLEVDYNVDEVEEFIKSNEAVILNQKIIKLEQELRTALSDLKNEIQKLNNPNITILKQVEGELFYEFYKNGIKVYGNTTDNKVILKNLGGKWNKVLSSWIFSKEKESVLVQSGINMKQV